MEQKEFLYKILLLGDAAVGKTCFLMQYTENTFQEIHMSTIGLDYKLKNVQLDENKIYKLQIWDTAGQDRFRSITKNYYKGAHGIILLYDVTEKKTFENVRNWIKQIKEEVNDNVCIILVGNKIDMEGKRVVSTEEGEKMAEEYDLMFFECSAKTGENVNEIFYNSADEIAKKIDQNYYDLENDTCGIKQGINRQNNPQIRLDNGSQEKKDKGCC